MQAIQEFSLAYHDGPYALWPSKTQLHRHGKPTGTRIPGYVMEAQYRCGERYLLATSWDCPFEEMQTFVLLSAQLEVLSVRDYGAPYASMWLESHEPTASDTVVFHCDSARDVVITVRERRRFWVGSLLGMQVVRRQVDDASK